MRRIFIGLICCVSFTACPSSLGNLLEIPLTNAEISDGLKEALNLGTRESVSFLSAKDGYFKSVYKIYLPAEARTVTDKLRILPGFDKLEDHMLEKINRAAEDAAKDAGIIFLSAIKSMSIQDALGILMGEKDAATQYLNIKSHQALYDQFQPIILTSLNKFGAIDYWEDAVSKYNKIPLLGEVNPRLDDYVTQEALKGLFALIALKELGIRSDIGQRISPLLQKVFKKQDAV